MVLSRRRALQVGAAVAASLAGCVGSADLGLGPEERPEIREVPAEGEPVSVTATAESEDAEYLPEENAVRYVAAWRHANPDEVENGSPPEREPVYETVPFEQWMAVESTSVAAQRAVDAVSERLDAAPRGVSFGVTKRYDEPRVLASREVLYDVEGNVKARPNVAFERLVAVTPTRVRVTLSFGGRRTTRTVPAVVRNGWLQET